MQINLYAYHGAVVKNITASLCGKILNGNQRALIWHRDLEYLTNLSNALWTHGRFLPHGTIQQPHARNQPILLTNETQNVNEAQCLILLENTVYNPHPWYNDLAHWKKCCDIFSAGQEESVQIARRDFYRDLAVNQSNVELYLYRQNPHNDSWFLDRDAWS